MKNSYLRRSFAGIACSACAAFIVGGLSSCSDDLLTGMPSWLGESIYGELESRGNFTETLKLIQAQDEDYVTVLSKTGSVTLFVADDDAWKEFYATNPWGVKSIEDLTPAQKKLLFQGNMLNSAYLVELLGNVQKTDALAEQVEGTCLRRESRVGIMDSVPVVLAKDFPEVNPIRMDKDGKQIDYWSRLRGKEKALILQDDNVASMIHFMPTFMQNNNITNDDVNFLTNGEISDISQGFVNGKSIVEADITCQNGYIHVVDGVPVQLDNMANVLAANPQFSIYKRLLDRFSYPSYDEWMTREYQRQHGGEDSVYVRRYFNSHLGHKFTSRDQNDLATEVGTQLGYDPGWNRYSLYSASGSLTYNNDAGVILAPTDEAMLQYLQEGGADLNERYANAGPGETAWDNAPDEVILPLLQNTMLTSLKSSIPSQFGSINNTASEPMGVKKEDIDKVLWANNGLIYQTNKVYLAPEYVSVFYPCVIRANEDLRLVYTVVANDNKVTGGEGFYAYLNNMGSKYTFVIPTDNALQRYYDPASRFRTDTKGASTAVSYQFFVNDGGYIAAYANKCDWNNLDEKGRASVSDEQYKPAPTTATNSTGQAFNHFKDILNSSLAVSRFTPDQEVYLSKNGNPVVVKWNGSKVEGVAGSFQYERGYFVPVIEAFDKTSEGGNGASLIIDEEPLMSTFTSPYAALNDTLREAQFGAFARMLGDADILNTTDGNNHATQDYAITSFNNYHYTIYVPNAQKVQNLIDSHLLPTGEDIDLISNCIESASLDEEEEAFLLAQKKEMKTVIQNFVNYHIQDNSVFVKGDRHSHDAYESACLDTLTNRFVKLYVSYEPGGALEVEDNVGNKRTVDSQYNNIMTRQYFFDGKDLKGTAVNDIYSSSYAVIHLIDDVLVPYKDCYYKPTDYEKVLEILNKHKDEFRPSTPTNIKRKK